MDERFKAFAGQLVNFCVKVQKGEQVIIHAHDVVPKPMILAIIRAVRAAGGNVADVWWDCWEFDSEILQVVDSRQLRILGMGRLSQISAVDVNIILRGFSNLYAMSSVSSNCMKMHSTGIEKYVKDERISHTRWILTRWPTDVMANMAGMPTGDFEDFFFKTVLLDYKKMSHAMDPLVKLMERTKVVRILGPADTDLTFSIEGMPAVKCDGHRNIPDGEVYTAPVRQSMNGIIHYNTPTINKEGQEFGGVRFEVKEGKIVKATCDSGDNERLNKFLDTDEGAQYFGEFSFGFNPHIEKPIKETLFDEKIHGSFHLTPGQCYELAPNGNDSAIHWDIVAIQREDYGGGEIYFDEKLIRKNGLFVPKDLHGLNPENLIK